jgi:hypothetical protein
MFLYICSCDCRDFLTKERKGRKEPMKGIEQNKLKQ